MSEKLPTQGGTIKVIRGDNGELINIFPAPQSEHIEDPRPIDDDPANVQDRYGEYDQGQEPIDEDTQEEYRLTWRQRRRAAKMSRVEDIQFTRKDKVLRGIGAATVYMTAVVGIPVAGAYVSNQVVSKVQYDVELNPWQQLENFAEIPSKIGDGYETVKKAIDVARYFGINDALGEKND